MIQLFLHYTKMLLARLKIFTLKVRITLFVMTVALTQTKHGSMNGNWFYTTEYGVLGDGVLDNYVETLSSKQQKSHLQVIIT